MRERERERELREKVIKLKAVLLLPFGVGLLGGLGFVGGGVERRVGGG